MDHEWLGTPRSRSYVLGTGILSIPLIAAAIIVLVCLMAWGLELGRFLLPHIGLAGPGAGKALLAAFAVLCVLLALTLLEAPIILYITIGQGKRIELIKGYFSPFIIGRYFYQFWSGRDGIGDLVERWRQSHGDIDTPLSKELREKFDELLRDDFGFGIYVFPMILLTAIAAIALFAGFYGGLTLAQAPPGPGSFLLGISVDLVTVAAIFGAYTWITSDAITRYYQSALHPSDLYWYALRLVVAVPLGQAIAALTLKGDASIVSAASSGPFLAFVISMFSFERISQILSAIANKALGAQAGTPSERNDLVIKLPGVDETTANRLSAEGITTVAQMAAADPVRTSIRTSLPFDFVLGLIDGALLWNYIGGNLDALRNYGFKGVTSILAYSDAALQKEPSETLHDDYTAAFAASRIAAAAAAAAIANVRTAEAICNAARQKRNDAENTRSAAVNLRNQAAIRASEVPPGSPGYEEAQAALAAANADLVRKADAVNEAESNLSRATAALDDAHKTEAIAGDAADKARARHAAARLALIGPGTLVSDAAKQAKMDESGLRSVMRQIARDDYADFIRQMMWVVPHIGDTTEAAAGGGAAPPKG